MSSSFTPEERRQAEEINSAPALAAKNRLHPDLIIGSPTIDMTTGRVGGGDSPSAGFDAELVAVCRELEQWRAECKAAEKAAPDDFPPTDWPAARYALVFYGLGGIGVLESPLLKGHHGLWAHVSLWIALVISIIASVIFVLRATGLSSGRFWRAAYSTFRKRDNYPFTQLRDELDRDLSAAARLQRFSLHTLESAQARIAAEDTELRERLAMLFGNPNMFLALSLLGAAWAAWKSFYSETNTANTVFLVGSVMAAALGVYTGKLRVSLIEFARCRSLLTLEIARRKAAEARADT